MQARIAHLRQEGGVGIEQPVEPVDQDADRQQIEQRLVARGFAARRRLGRRQPFGRRERRFARRERFEDGFAGGDRASLPFSVSSRADNCRASSSKALFSTGVSAGCFASPGARNGKTFAATSAGNSVAVSVGASLATFCDIFLDAFLDAFLWGFLGRFHGRFQIVLM